MSNDRALYCAIFAAVFLCYAYCSYPTIAPRDSADLAAAAASLGVAHPPGYPLYFILGKAWIALFGLANPAYRLNILSAVCGSLAVLSVFALVKRACGVWPAAAAAAAFAFSSSLWKFSLLQEKYSIQALFAGLLLALASEKSERRLLLSALLFGLGLVNHQTLILLAPALAYLWRGRFPKTGQLVLFAAGLALYAAVGIRLNDWRLTWAVLTRADYGTLTLSGQFARPLSLASAFQLMTFFASGLVRAVTWPVAVLACLGAWELAKRHRELGTGLALAFLAFGPFYFILSRFDVSGWVAQSVLEPAFIVPSLVVCAAAGFGASRITSILDRDVPAHYRGSGTARLSGPGAVLAVAVFCAVTRTGACHRDDLSAYDYAKDLRRFMPLGSAAIVAGDSAYFGLDYFGRVMPGEYFQRAVLSSVEDGKRRWLEERLASKEVFVAGLPLRMLGELGLQGNPRFLEPRGPVQGVVGSKPAPGDRSWELSILRPTPAALKDDSYSRDILYSYAYARFLSGRLDEAYGRSSETNDKYAALLDPETYRLEKVRR